MARASRKGKRRAIQLDGPPRIWTGEVDLKCAGVQRDRKLRFVGPTAEQALRKVVNKGKWPFYARARCRVVRARLIGDPV